MFFGVLCYKLVDYFGWLVLLLEKNEVKDLIWFVIDVFFIVVEIIVLGSFKDNLI